MTAGMDLTASPAFKLLLAANLMARPFLEEIAPAHDITLAEWRCLIVLAAHPEISNVEIAEAAGLDSMTTSRALRRLTRHKRVVRRRDPSDSRRVIARLSPDGEQLFGCIAAEAERRMAVLLADLSEDERREFSRLLDKMIRRLRDARTRRNKPGTASA